MAEQETYNPPMPDRLIRAVGFEAAALACRLPQFEVKKGEKKGAVFVSLSYLAGLWGIDQRRLAKAAEKLQALQIWTYKKGDGRGHVTEWKKGTNFATFMTRKRVQNSQIKGTDFAPYNIDNNIDGLTNAHERVTNQPIVSNLIAGDTPAPPIDMEQFDIFWRAFFFGSYAKYEKEQAAYKERAAAVFAQMDTTKRERMTRELRNGKRYDKSHFVLWYIQNYNPAPSIWYAGDPELTADMVGQLQVLKYKGRVAYCAPGDVQVLVNLGARLF